MLGGCGVPDPKCIEPVEGTDAPLEAAGCEVPLVAFDDVDGDGLGDPLTGHLVCALADGESQDATDCDPAAFVDTDGDGTQDCADPDVDGDGLRNDWDAAPLDPTVVRGPQGGLETEADLVVTGETEAAAPIPLAAPIVVGDGELTKEGTRNWDEGTELLVLAVDGPAAGTHAFATVFESREERVTVEPPFATAFDPALGTVWVIEVQHAANAVIEAGGRYRGGVVAVRATGDIAVRGVADAAGAGFPGGAGAYCVITVEDEPFTLADERQCEIVEAESGTSIAGPGAIGQFVGTGGAGGAAPSAEDLANAGAGASHVAQGGCGGSIDGDCASEAGVAYGDVELQGWFFGSGGGGGGVDADDDRLADDNIGGAGGDGGGIILLWANGRIQVDGTLRADGTPGGDGRADDAFAGAGGGGSGGTIQLSAPEVYVNGRVSAAGGAGGEFLTLGAPWPFAAGGDGSGGRIRLDTASPVVVGPLGEVVADTVHSGAWVADPPPLSYPPLPDPVIDPTPPVIDGDERPVVVETCAGDYLQGGFGCQHAGAPAWAMWTVWAFAAAVMRRRGSAVGA